jgi:outer membrane murein-binding lipoprotein Lpp
MRIDRQLALAIVMTCLSGGPGCVQSGPLQNHRTTVGTLKASVSQLEFEKEQLRKQVAQLKAEGRRTEDRLAQEEAANGELSARLDNARVLLRGRGFDTDGLDGSTRSADDPFDDATTTPASREPRSGRKPPFARIPGRTDSSSSSEDADDDPFNRSSSRRSGTLGPQSRLDSRSSWMPVARGTGGFGSPMR